MFKILKFNLFLNIHKRRTSCNVGEPTISPIFFKNVDRR
jgi:hypothetical protein